MPKPNHNGKSGGAQPPNKSQAIREVIAQKPAAKTKEIVEILGAQGIRVQPSLVYMVRSQQHRRRRRAKRDQVAATSRRTGSANPIDLVLKAKALAEEAGGIKNLKMLVDLLAE